MSIFDAMTEILQDGCMAAFEESDPVAFTPAGGSAVEVRAIFDRESLVVEAGGEFGVSSYKPMVSFSREEFVAAGLGRPKQGDWVTMMIDGVATVFEVVEPQHDGRSEYRAILARV